MFYEIAMHKCRSRGTRKISESPAMTMIEHKQSTLFLELIPPLVFRSPETRGELIALRNSDLKKFRLRRAKISITRVLIDPTARRRRNILRFCACKNAFSFAKTVFLRSKKQGISMKTHQKSKKILRGFADPN